MFVASIPCLLGFNVLSGVHIGKLGSILDIEDYIVSNLLLPIGALIFVVVCSTKFGWGFDNFLKETNEGKGIKFAKGFKYYFKYVLPLIILAILISGLIPG